MRSGPETVATKKEYQAMLAQFLPLWCEQDVEDLTPRRRKILIGEVKRIAHQGVGMHRNIDGPTPLLSEADTDYALALLVALRRPLSRTTATSGNCLDRKTRVALEHLPRTVRPDDCNRQHLQETAQALLQQTGL